MPKPKTPPLPIGTLVNIDIAQGDCIAHGVVREAEYDEGWHYRVEVTGGDDCNRHREQSGELWCCDFEVQPAGTAGPRTWSTPCASGAPTMYSSPARGT